MTIEKSDPVKACTVHKEIGCTHVDGYMCDTKECDIKKKYDKSKFAGCPPYDEGSTPWVSEGWD